MDLKCSAEQSRRLSPYELITTRFLVAYVYERGSQSGKPTFEDALVRLGCLTVVKVERAWLCDLYQPLLIYNTVRLNRYLIDVSSPICFYKIYLLQKDCLTKNYIILQI